MLCAIIPWNYRSYAVCLVTVTFYYPFFGSSKRRCRLLKEFANRQMLGQTCSQAPQRMQSLAFPAFAVTTFS